MYIGLVQSVVGSIDRSVRPMVREVAKSRSREPAAQLRLDRLVGQAQLVHRAALQGVESRRA
jgi:hypothetical protein